jgi:phosphatidylserine/phosphatidylglycerophosphate/cardiolipin synthase-like enzyme
MQRTSRHTNFQIIASRFLLGVACALGMAGCASLPDPVPRPDTHALADPSTTALGRLAAAATPSPEVSGFRLLVSGDEAFGALAELANRAQRTLDLQYYLIRTEPSSRALMLRVRAAADRGVKVRLLLDDLNTAGQDTGLLRLTQHPNIEVRLYNPFPAGRPSLMSKLLTSLTDFSRINQRMHNKMFVADNALAITGGRNLGDAYFVRSEKSNFLDLDVIVAGPAVRRLSSTFDAFWNNPLAYPVGAIVSQPPPEVPASDSPANATAAAAPASASSAPVAAIPTDTPFAREIRQGQLKLVWAPSKLLADKPSKIESQGEPTQNETIADDVESLMRSAKSEVILISPYFVPGQRGVDIIGALRQKNVRFRVLTNSLATTDAPAVHIGYARYRVPLLESGVELNELRAHVDAPRANIGSFGSSQASLHAKVMVIDRKTVLIGSMNMDPRSQKLNSEMGFVIRSPAIAEQIAKVYDEIIETGYRVTLDDGKTLHWRSDAPGAKLDTTNEPEASFWMRMGLRLIGPLAPDEML